MIDEDWLFLIEKFPRTLKIIKEYALEKEDYEKLQLIKEHEEHYQCKKCLKLKKVKYEGL